MMILARSAASYEVLAVSMAMHACILFVADYLSTYHLAGHS